MSAGPASAAIPARFAAVLQQRRLWAEENGLNPDVIEQLYRNLINHFIAEEIKHWQQRTG